MSDDLVERLRDRNSPVLDEDAHEAADRIEELEAALRRTVDALEGAGDVMEGNCQWDLAAHFHNISSNARATLSGTPLPEPPGPDQ